jgi:hypothetical protein
MAKDKKINMAVTYKGIVSTKCLSVKLIVRQMPVRQNVCRQSGFRQKDPGPLFSFVIE